MGLASFHFAASSSLASLTGILASAYPPCRTHFFVTPHPATPNNTKKTASQRPLVLLERAMGFRVLDSITYCFNWKILQICPKIPNIDVSHKKLLSQPILLVNSIIGVYTNTMLLLKKQMKCFNHSLMTVKQYTTSCSGYSDSTSV